MRFCIISFGCNFALLSRNLLLVTVFHCWQLNSANLGMGYARRLNMRTRLAIPVWDEQVSTTADFAGRLLVVDLDEGREVKREEMPWQDTAPVRRAQALKNRKVEVLLCGAISQPLAWFVARAGIHVIPFVAGPVDNVLAAYLCGRLADPRYLLPGSPPGARRRWRHGRGFHGGWE